MPPRFNLFRVFYTTVFTFLSVLLVALNIVTPVDCIRQTLRNKQLYNSFVIAGCYVFTILLGALIYASRLYTTRSVLAGIPKTWVPVEDGDVSKKVRAMIVAALTRSAAIAFDARPHAEPRAATAISDLGARKVFARPAEREELDKRLRGELVEGPTAGDKCILLPPLEPTWTTIAHDGWASPTAPDLPNLEYATVITELPHLIEARAVSMAPLDSDAPAESALPDLVCVDALQRPINMGLREYLNHLTVLGMVPTVEGAVVTTFLESYEHARFSTRALSATQFSNLMRDFANLLRLMQPLSAEVLEILEAAYSDLNEDMDEDGDPGMAAQGSDDRSIAAISQDAPRSISSHEDDQGSVIARRTLSRAVSKSSFSSSGTVHTAPSRRRSQSRQAQTRLFSLTPASRAAELAMTLGTGERLGSEYRTDEASFSARTSRDNQRHSIHGSPLGDEFNDPTANVSASTHAMARCSDPPASIYTVSSRSSRGSSFLSGSQSPSLSSLRSVIRYGRRSGRRGAKDGPGSRFSSRHESGRS